MDESKLAQQSAPQAQENQKATNNSLAHKTAQFIRTFSGRRLSYATCGVFFLSFVVIFFADPRNIEITSGQRNYGNGRCGFRSAPFVLVVFLAWALPFTCLYSGYRRYDAFRILFTIQAYTATVLGLAVVWVVFQVLEDEDLISDEELKIVYVYLVGLLVAVTCLLEWCNALVFQVVFVLLAVFFGAVSGMGNCSVLVEGTHTQTHTQTHGTQPTNSRPTTTKTRESNGKHPTTSPFLILLSPPTKKTT
jgi:hypothetical protein